MWPTDMMWPTFEQSTMTLVTNCENYAIYSWLKIPKLEVEGLMSSNLAEIEVIHFHNI